MALNTNYVVAPDMQEYFVDKDTGLPLSGGKVFFFSDVNRTTPKTVYSIAGNQANYTFAPLPNPMILSGVGTAQDNNGNDIPVYYYPFDADGNQELYYIVVQNSLGVPQFVRQAWPPASMAGGGGGGGGDIGTDESINYIPNGQLLAHNDFYSDGLPSGTSDIAYGGFTIEIPFGTSSTNTLDFIPEQFNLNTPQSPRFIARFECVIQDPLDAFKILRIKFNDVNKFSTKTPFPYTFQFWAQSNVTVPINIAVYKFFGTNGSAPISDVQKVGTITTATNNFLNFTLDFGTNAGFNIDTVNNDDFVAIDIQLPVNFSFIANFSDFVLTPGQVTLTGFPVETNADMLTRGVAGWMDVPDPNGFDLFLPAILTKTGLTFDQSTVGTGGYEMFPVNDPKSTSPISMNNKMPCDGAVYQAYDYVGTTAGQVKYVRAPNGIPYARLFEYLQYIASPTYNAFALPVTGTGPDFISMVGPIVLASDSFRLTYNVSGAGSVTATDGGAATGWTFAPGLTIGGSTTGATSIGYFSSTTAPNTVLCQLSSGLPLIGENAGTSGFTFTELATETSIKAFQQNAFLINPTNGASLVTGAAGKYFLFSNTATNYYMWFNTGTESDPLVPGRVGIQVLMTNPTVYLAQDVANIIRDAINTFNFTQITVTGVPPAGSYFNFTSNPSANRNFYVWFTVDGVGADPLVAGRTPLRCDLLSSMTPAAIKVVLFGVINSFQYAAPLDNGTFYRNADPTSIWDLDASQRFSYTPGISGNNPATYEFQQFLSHYHTDIGFDTLNTGASGPKAVAAVGTQSVLFSDASGGSETRPVNVTRYPFIRY
jgi:hypothetical protein